MSNEGQDQQFRPPFLDPLSGITVTRPPAWGEDAQSWTPPPPDPEPAPPEQSREESLEDILEMFRGSAVDEPGAALGEMDRSAPAGPEPAYAAAPAEPPYAAAAAGPAYAAAPTEPAYAAAAAEPAYAAAAAEPAYAAAPAEPPYAAAPEPASGEQGPAGVWTPPAAEGPGPAPKEEPTPEEAPFQPPWMGGGAPPPPPPQAESAYGGAAQYAPPRYQAPPGAAPQYAPPQYQAPPGGAAPQQMDPTATAAVAAAMAAVLTDIGRTRFGYQTAPGQPVLMGGGYAGGMENMMASIMAEASRISGQPMAAPVAQEAQVDVSDIVAEVYGWDAPRQSQTPPEPVEAEVRHEFTDPIQAEAARVQARSAAANSEQWTAATPYTNVETAGEAPRPQPEQERARSDSGPSHTPPKEKNGPVQKKRKKSGKPKIAKDARAKGMHGGIDFNKVSVNMAVQVKTASSPSRAIPIFLLVMACIAAFSYFGVYQFIGRIGAEESRLRAMEQQRDQITLATKDFPEVQKEYTLYGNTWMNEVELAQVDVLDVLAVVESHLLPAAKVESVAMTQDLLSVNLSGVTLEAAAAIVDRLEQLDIVQSVAVYTAATQEKGAAAQPGGEAPVGEPVEPQAPTDAQNTIITMSIVMQLPDAADEAETPEAAPTEGGGEGGGAG